MIHKNKNYHVSHALILPFSATSSFVMLYIALAFVHALMPTAGRALTTAYFVDTASAILEGEKTHNYIYQPLIILLLVLGVSVTMGSIMQLVKASVSLNLQRKLKPDIVRIHSQLDFKHIENAKSWELISRVSRDPVKSVMDGFDGLMQIMHVVVTIMSVLILIASQVWWAAPIIIIFSTPMFWLSMYAGKKNYQAGRYAEKFNRRTEYLDEVLTGRDGLDERTLFGYGSRVSKQWQKQFESGRILQLKVTAKMFLITKASSIILALIALSITLTLINPVVSGDLSAGMFMGIIGAVFGMIHQLGWQMSNSLQSLSSVSEYMKDLTEFTKLAEAEGALTEPDVEPMDFYSLEFRNVRFKYPTGNQYILNGLSFRLEKGNHYAFVGKNGSGKTTITKLLTGLYNEYEGEILINDKELREYSANTLKALFSMVYQDFAKYSVSFKDNILLGNIGGNNTDSQVMNVVDVLGLSETVQKLKNGIDTHLGKIAEDGQDLSGGQWQRVAIARSLNSRARIKILDEPTAALDPISESLMYMEFEKLMKGKTTIFISHRLGSTKLADKILVIDGGVVSEHGSHDELISANGQYADMFNAQRSWYQ